jgi:hypothetical protein
MRLSYLLKEKNFNVIHLSRRANPRAEFPAFEWDIRRFFAEPDAIEKADYILNLSGAGVADKRWTDARKKIIIDSRVNSTRLLKSMIEKKREPLKAYVSASAIGYYGNRGDAWLKETDPPGDQGFLPESVAGWEEAITGVEATGTRTVALRVGLVLSTKGGALQKMMLPFKFFNATYFGDGEQWYSWIHIDDVCRMFIEAIENEKLAGVYNAVAPNPVTNKDLVIQLKKALGKPALLMPAPASVLRLAMGEMADMILDSARVSSEKIQQAGFQFRFPQLRPALDDLLLNDK